MQEPNRYIFLSPLQGRIPRASAMKHTKKRLILLEGRKYDPTFYPVIYGAKEDDDWTDPKVWKKANPCSGNYSGY